MHALFAFVDAYGDPSLGTEKEGVTDHFVVVAVMVETGQLSALQQGIEVVRSKHFNSAEMKSSGIGSNWKRRNSVISDLLKLPFKCHVLSVDKRQIFKDSGLQYKRPFLKYIHGLLYSRLYGALPDLHVIADRHGSDNFMDGFRDYVHRRHIPTLFDTDAGFRFEDSASQPLIQLADVLAGTIGHALRPDSNRTLDSVLQDLSDHILTFAEWPPVARRYVPPAGNESELDRVVRIHSFNQASVFLNNVADSRDPNVRLQIEVLRHLYFNSQYISESAFISTKALRKLLRDVLGADISTHTFRTTVVAPLRDAGVLLASGPKGYKIPVSQGDIMSFVEHGHLIAAPLLARLNRARNELLTASNGRLDILGAEELAYLRTRPGA